MSLNSLNPTDGASPNTIGAWGHADASSHLVQFYESDAFLLDALSRWFGEGLRANDVCIYIGTGAHRVGLEERLSEHGLDLQILAAQGRYICFDARETLAQFMVNHWPDEARFTQAIDRVLPQGSSHHNVRSFGEMVALLYARGDQEAAVRLEQLWNGLMKTRRFSLCCAYPVDSFGSDPDPTLFTKICAEHASVFPAESDCTFGTEGERPQSMSLLDDEAEVVDKREQAMARSDRAPALSQRELVDFIENAVEGLHHVGHDGRILWANPAQLNLLGYRAEEYVGHELAEFCVERSWFDEFWGRLIRSKTVYDFQTSLKCKNTKTKHVLIRSRGVWDNQKFLYAQCFIRDITERVELDQELKVRVAELAQADERKSEFLAMLGHELRNPLSAVRDAIVTAQVDTERRDRALAIARRQTDQLAVLVDDLLDAGRITRGRIALRKEVTSVGRLISQAVEEAQCLVEPRQHQLRVTVSPQAEEAQIDADPARLRQVIGNLMHNAAKFTPSGGRIEVSAELTDGELVLCMRDSGIGISPELLPHVFDLFTQSERPLNRSHGGLGIGLTLVRRLIEMHGGRVEAHSEGAGRGSEFTIHLPILREARWEAVERQSPDEAPGRARVLVVEDNADAAEALMMSLELLGHQTTTVTDGLTAVDVARAGEFDAAVVDIGLPGIDGYEVAHRMRMLGTGKAMKLIALTGYGQEADRQRALSAGFDEHLIKPVKIERLHALLGQLRSPDSAGP